MNLIGTPVESPIEPRRTSKAGSWCRSFGSSAVVDPSWRRLRAREARADGFPAPAFAGAFANCWEALPCLNSAL